MLNFFRKIRQRLFSENKFSKYLLYALGEIVLVVIGILIALQINNASERQKTKEKELVILTELKQNLEKDLRIIEGTLHGNRNRIHSNDVIRYALEKSLPWHDSLKHHFGNIWGNWQLLENNSAWENLKSIGLDLVSDNALRNNISDLYSTKYVYVENLEKGFDDNFQRQQFYPQILRHLNIDTMWVSAVPENYNGLTNDREFLEVLKMNIFYRHFMQNQYSEVRDAVDRLIRQLENHIKYLKVEHLGRDIEAIHRFIVEDVPAASKVQIAGSFNDWSPSDMVFKDGYWQKDVKLNTDEMYYYKYIINGRWVHDTENPITQNDGHSGLNSVIIVKSDN